MTDSYENRIPEVDISTISSNFNLESRRLAAKDLALATQVHGCVGVTGHIISAQTLKEAFQITKKMFDLPYKDKMKAPHPDALTPHRGFSGVGREKTSGKAALETADEEQKKAISKISDHKETYEIGSEDNVEQYNIWLPDDVLPGFRAFIVDFFWKLNSTCMVILDTLMIAVDLTLEEQEKVRGSGFDSLGPSHSLELLHHPLPKSDMLYLNIADMFDCISNGFYLSLTHRVTILEAGLSFNTKEVQTAPSRYSIPYFVVPEGDGVIEPQPSRVKLDGKANYEPTSFNEYSMRMFKATQIQGTV